MDTFQKIFIFCTFFGLLFILFQVWWEKNRGANIRDIQVSKRIVYRSLPIIWIPVFFMQIPWIWRISIVIFSLIIMQVYFLFMCRMRRLLGTDKDDTKDRPDRK